MKARTKLERRVTDLSNRLTSITKSQEEWAYDTCIKHWVYANKTTAACMDCGTDIELESISRKRAICSGCGRKSKVMTTLKRTDNQTNYFAIAELVQEFQVIRNFEIKSYHKKGEPVRFHVFEILQYWVRLGDEKLTMIGHNHYVQGFCDSWGGDWSIRKERGWYSKYKVYQRFFHPDSRFENEYRKYGIDYRMKQINFLEAIRVLPKNSQAETLLKSRQYELLGYLVDNEGEVNMYWNTIKIALRNKYKIKDASIWFDYLDLLRYFRKDLHNPMYICPKNLKKAHDYWMLKKQLKIAKQNEEARKKKALKDQRNFNKHIAKFKNISFSAEGICIVVLQSVDEFLVESEKLKHCLFTNEYYAKTDSLIMSARIDNEPVETIEICLKKFKVLQSRGLHNNPTDHHDTIVKLVKGNMDKVKNAIKGVKVKRLKKQDYVQAV